MCVYSTARGPAVPVARPRRVTRPRATSRRPATHTHIMPYIRRPDPARDSSRFGNQIPNMYDRYKWVSPFRPDLGDALGMVEHV
jgi:hypothetical protein|eukprot:4400463-Prymnesium_polylepis.1